VQCLGEIDEQSPERTTALLAALSDAKSNVRAEAAKQLGTVRTPEVSAALHAAVDNDSSFSVEANALSSLAKVDSTAALPLLISKVDQWSYADRLSSAVLNAIADLDSSKAVEVAIKKLNSGEETRSRYTALRILRKYAKGNEEVIDTELSLIKNRRLQRFIVPALGDDADKRAIPALETIARDTSNPVHEDALQAIEKIKKRTGQ
jgi:HEAT repeat protein